MCGIAGLIDYPNEDCIRRMVRAMHHRGPDDNGIYVDRKGRVALGHARLAIIDLTNLGHQPMSYLERRYWITFNGEIYNFRPLRSELETLGYTFKSNSDTEVVLASYAQWGNRCPIHLRGMFAFAIWDSRERTLFAARDRFGVKPLYYWVNDSTMVFSSEVKTVLASGIVPRIAEVGAIWEYLSYGCIRQPHTIIQGVRSLLPGYFMEWRNGLVETRCYWDIEEETRERREHAVRMSYEDAVLGLRWELEEAARRHLVSDVPVGAFLSGGIDSTAVVGLVAQIGGPTMKTFSVGVSDIHRGKNELGWARIAAARFGTDHSEILLSGRDLKLRIESLIEAIDQPSVDGTNTYFISQVAGSRVKVCLSGLGGDELFAGYPHFEEYARLWTLAPGGVPLVKRVLPTFSGLLPGRWMLPLERMATDATGRLESLRRLIPPEKKRMIASHLLIHAVSADDSFESVQQYLRSDLGPVAQMSYFELCVYLRDTLLRDSDAMSMAHSLELRPMLLDSDLAEYIFSLPDSFKLQKSQTKAILVSALKELLPREITRRSKMGFELPIGDWLTKEMSDEFLAAFHTPLARTIFEEKYIEKCSRMVTMTNPLPAGMWAYFVLLRYLDHSRIRVL